MRDRLFEALKLAVVVGSAAIWGNAILQSLGVPDSVFAEGPTIFVLAYAAARIFAPDDWTSARLLASSAAIALITSCGNLITDAAEVSNSLLAEWIIAISVCFVVMAIQARNAPAEQG